MSHRKLSYLLLAAGAAAFLGGAALFFCYAPYMAGRYRDMYPALAHLYWPGLVTLWIMAACYIKALGHYMAISCRIGRNAAFCRENCASMHRIALSLGLAAALWLAAALAVLVTDLPVGPVWLVAVMASMATCAVAVVAWVLAKLLEKAVELKDENDMTV